MVQLWHPHVKGQIHFQGILYINWIKFWLIRQPYSVKFLFRPGFESSAVHLLKIQIQAFLCFIGSLTLNFFFILIFLTLYCSKHSIYSMCGSACPIKENFLFFIQRFLVNLLFDVILLTNEIHNKRYYICYTQSATDTDSIYSSVVWLETNFPAETFRFPMLFY